MTATAASLSNTDYNRHGEDPDTSIPERSRFFSRKHTALYSVRVNGAVFAKTLERGWGVRATEVHGDELAARFATFDRWIGSLRPWQLEVHDLPSLTDLEDWTFDSVCETPTGHTVEPDGEGPDGVPSWLRIFRLI